MAGGFKIETPKGAVFTTTGKNGKIIARLEWNKNFSAERSDQFNQTQRFVDSEVFTPFLPLCSLFRLVCWINLAYWGTDVGSGEVNYIAPYAAAQYYRTSVSRPYDSQRGAKWFERMKIDHKDENPAGRKKRFQEAK